MVDHAHIFWTCPSIQPFCREVATIISKTLGFSISTTFTSLYLGYSPDRPNKEDAYLLKILLAASKKKSHYEALAQAFLPILSNSCNF